MEERETLWIQLGWNTAEKIRSYSIIVELYQKKYDITKVLGTTNTTRKLTVTNSSLSHETTEALMKKTQQELESLTEGCGEDGNLKAVQALGWQEQHKNF